MNIFQRYVAYLKDNPKGYWFRRKLFGWGWTPATKEGWFILGFFFVALLFVVSRADRYTTQEEGFTYLVLPVILLIVLLLLICWIKGEPPKWQFGFPEEDETPKDSERENI